MTRRPALDLLILESTDPTRPHPTIAPIYAATYSTSDDKGYDGRPLLSAECRTLREVEEAIDRLSNNLEAIRKKARARFTR
jgi:hypothetical protein